MLLLVPFGDFRDLDYQLKTEIDSFSFIKELSKSGLDYRGGVCWYF